VTLPRWVAAGKNSRAGVLHEASDGWHANGSTGPLGVYPTEEAAELAIKSAPVKVKQKRAPKAEPPEAMMNWRGLTADEGGAVVRDERGRAIGGFMPAGPRFAAWAHGKSLGLFDGPGQAKSAIFAAHRVGKKRKRP
jgi:hypothetical protein